MIKYNIQKYTIQEAESLASRLRAAECAREAEEAKLQEAMRRVWVLGLGFGV